MQTAILGVAGIGSALVVVVAVLRVAADALALFTGVRLGADRPIIACDCVVLEVTAGFRKAGIVRADIIVIACERGASYAETITASVVGSASVAVIAIACLGGVLATIERMAGVRSTGVSIVTVEDRFGNTDARQAMVAFGT